MHNLPLDIVRHIYSFDDNIVANKNKKKYIIELKSKFGHYRYNYNNCMSEILFESSLYNNVYIICNQKLTISTYMIKRNMDLKRRIKNGDNSIMIQRENSRLHNFLPTRGVIKLL
jgi:hypothetical protein|tara:strand:+ start:183 stop:527 length:345 start_codon:yes stop_codon:yes gene_type:complete